MESTFKEIDLNNLPVSFRVLGYGESLHNLIQEIKQLGYEGLQADILSQGEILIPTDEDKMLIILCSSACTGLKSLLNTFHQAGVLTIVISTDSLHIPTQTYDSLMVAGRNEMIGIVKALLNPVFFQGRLTYDFNDLAFTLRDSCHFITIFATGSGPERMKKAVTSLSDKLSIHEGVENISLIIQSNERTMEPPLCMGEMSLIADYVSQLPESVTVIWAMYNDETLDCNTIGLSVIASGKAMNIKR